MQKSDLLLEVNDLKVHFKLRGSFLQPNKKETVKAVDGVTFHVKRGETLGMVGESGCGKSTTGLSILRMVEPNSGKVFLDGTDVTALGRRELRRERRKMQMIFQDPFGALNPRMTVLDIIGEPLTVHKMAKNFADYKRQVLELMEMVGLNPGMAQRFPHEFSGGQRQRIGIARALAARPQMIICDEPVSALDVSIQAQVINLLEDLQKEFGLTYLFIAHDLAVVKHICDRIVVMYLGRIVEVADRDDLYRNPKHPYTQALLSAIPIADPDPEVQKRFKPALEGEVPSPVNPPPGCPFHPRCPHAWSACSELRPKTITSEDGHSVACHMYDPAVAPTQPAKAKEAKAS